mmetsp:Transcript_9668/g.29296  ORF Transcript_9668/g.29296 Transcript_9668/m.29296 type:complete len:597 (-) Transcript_9668:192-1982(-)
MAETPEGVSEGSDSDMLRAEEELVPDGSDDAMSSSDEDDQGTERDNVGDMGDTDEEEEDGDDDVELHGDTMYCINCTAPLTEESMCEDCGHERCNDKDLFCETGFPAESKRVDSRIALLYDERMELHEEGHATPHPERPDRIRAVMAKLLASGLAAQCRRVQCREATVPELAAVHSDRLIRLVQDASKEASSNSDAGVSITADTYVNAYTNLCARLAAGGAAEVASVVARGEAPHGAAVVRPPGHHAESGMAMGFCFFNNAAVAARAAQAAGARRIVILDWDIHHGNGTQHIFEHDPSVLYISVHRYDHGHFYPGTGAADEVGLSNGEGFTVNLPWDTPDMQNGDYLAAFNQVLVPIAYEFNPDLIIVSAGFDAADGDPIGQCRVTPEGFAHMTAMLKPIAPMVLLLEGGYNLQSTADSTEACLRVLLGEQPGVLPGQRFPSQFGSRAIQQAITVQSRYWKCLRATAELLGVVSMTSLQPARQSDAFCYAHTASDIFASAPSGGEGEHASAQPSETEQIKRSTSAGASGDTPSGSGRSGGSGGAGDVTSAKWHTARRVIPHRKPSAAATKCRVLLAIHKRAMQAYWRRQQKLTMLA